MPVGSINPAAVGSEREIADAVAQLARRVSPDSNCIPAQRLRSAARESRFGACGRPATAGPIVFLDTLFRQPGQATRNAPDVVDALAVAAPHTQSILLHGGGSQILAVSEVVAVHANLVLDLSFTIHRFSGSSVDDDLRFLMRTFDRRMVVGSDFPEYEPLATATAYANCARGSTRLNRTTCSPPTCSGCLFLGKQNTAVMRTLDAGQLTRLHADVGNDDNDWRSRNSCRRAN